MPDRRGALAFVCVAWFIGCGATTEKSTGTNWVECTTDTDCAGRPGTYCGPNRVCISKTRRIVGLDDGGTPDAPASGGQVGSGGNRGGAGTGGEGGSGGTPGANGGSGNGGAPKGDASTGGEASDAASTFDAGAAPPSCASGGDGLTNCGATEESCCASLVVPGGTFFRRYDVTVQGEANPNLDGGARDPSDPATVSSFSLDKYEVTVGRFRRFVTAWNGGAGWMPAVGSGKHVALNAGAGVGSSQGGETGWQAAFDYQVSPTTEHLLCTGAIPNPYETWTDAPGGSETAPMNCVNWFEAYAFCIWDGGFLPTEAEWEYASAGGDEQRLYPWGSAAPGVDNQYSIYSCYYGNQCTPGGSSPFTNALAQVGTATLGAGRWGHLDLAGNVSEWTLDYYANHTYETPCVDCAYLTPGSMRTFHGSSFFYDGFYNLAAVRVGAGPETRQDTIGFRCARSGVK